jgi:hypothetical protein
MLATVLSSHAGDGVADAMLAVMRCYHQVTAEGPTKAALVVA